MNKDEALVRMASGALVNGNEGLAFDTSLTAA